MLFARIRRRKRLNTRQLAGSQGVVCKIRQPPLLVPQALLPAILFHLPRVVLTVFLPISWVRLAPFPRTLQADLLIQRIGSHLLPMIIGAALALACGPAANLLLRMITIRLKTLSTVAATVMLHQTAPEELSMKGTTSEFERRVCGRQRPYDYAVQSDLQNQQIIQLTIGIRGSSAA